MLSFYSFGVMLHKRDGNTITEYPVDPSQIGAALSTNMTFDTGILGSNAVFVRVNGDKKTVVEYRPPQMTGIYVEATENPIRVVLPGLLMIRSIAGKGQPEYRIYAVKKRPVTGEEALFNAPLPNIYSSGGVCWGTVIQVSDAAKQGTSLAEDWTSLLGSPFNDHGVGDKSKAHPKDIRKQLIALEARKARAYPLKDLKPSNKTLNQVLKGL